MGTFNLFLYDGLGGQAAPADLLARCEKIASGSAGGLLYDIGGYTALLLYGESPVTGEIWRCPLSILAELDQYAGVETGEFRRIGHEIPSTNGLLPCWIYVAGPALRRRLLPSARLLHDTPTRG